MIVSIFTDISINPQLKTGGYAFYIGCKEGFTKKAGVLKEVTNKTNTAEMQCIANAIHTLTRSKYKGVTSVRIYTDSSQVIDLYNGGCCGLLHDRKTAHALEEIKLTMIEFCLSRGGKIRDFRKAFSLNLVKGHTGNKDKMSVINAWCDTSARKQMRAASDKLK